MAKQGKTTGNLKMRSGPGMEFEPPIAFLVPDTALEILGEQGEWWKVRVAGKEGYVGKKYVAITESPDIVVSAGENPAGKVTDALSKDSARREEGGAGFKSAAPGRETGDHKGVNEK